MFTAVLQDIRNFVCAAAQRLERDRLHDVVGKDVLLLLVQGPDPKGEPETNVVSLEHCRITQLAVPSPTCHPSRYGNEVDNDNQMEALADTFGATRREVTLLGDWDHRETVHVPFSFFLGVCLPHPGVCGGMGRGQDGRQMLVCLDL